MVKLTKEDRIRIKRLFKRLDSDGNGEISLEEATEAYGKKGLIFISEFDRDTKKKHSDAQVDLTEIFFRFA